MWTVEEETRFNWAHRQGKDVKQIQSTVPTKTLEQVKNHIRAKRRKEEKEETIPVGQKRIRITNKNDYADAKNKVCKRWKEEQFLVRKWSED